MSILVKVEALSTICSGVVLAGRARRAMSAYVIAFRAVVPAAPANAPRTKPVTINLRPRVRLRVARPAPQELVGVRASLPTRVRCVGYPTDGWRNRAAPS